MQRFGQLREAYYKEPTPLPPRQWLTELCPKNGSDPLPVVCPEKPNPTHEGSDPFFGESRLTGLCPRDLNDIVSQ